MKKLKLQLTVIEVNGFGVPVDHNGKEIPPEQHVIGQKFGAVGIVNGNSAEAFKTVYDALIHQMEPLIINEAPWNTP